MLDIGLGSWAGPVFRAPPGPPFNPLDLFASGETGGWYDPSDLTTMFQDEAGTTPVTADGQSVGQIRDKSGRGNHLTQATAGSRPIYRTAGGKHWLELNGTSHFLVRYPMTITASGAYSSATGVRFNSNTGVQHIIDADSNVGRLAQILRNSAGILETIAFAVPLAVFADSGPAITAASNCVISQVCTGAAAEAFVNGAGNGATAMTGTPASMATAFKLGASSQGGEYTLTAGYYGGRNYGALIVGRALTATERAGLEGWLAGKF